MSNLAPKTMEVFIDTRGRRIRLPCFPGVGWAELDLHFNFEDERICTAITIMPAFGLGFRAGGKGSVIRLVSKAQWVGREFWSVKAS